MPTLTIRRNPRKPRRSGFWLNLLTHFWIVPLVLTVTSCGGGSSSWPPTGSTTIPTVISTTPAANAIGVAGNTTVIAAFNKAMDPLSVTAATFTVRQGGTQVPGRVVYGPGTTATFTPSSRLADTALLFTANLTTGVKDLAGTPLAKDFTWSFTTGTVPDTTAPTVSSTAPANAATGVLINSKLSATFSEAMDPTSLMVNVFSLSGPGNTPVFGTVNYVGTTATFTPSSNLAGNTTFTSLIKGGAQGAKDLAGNALASNYAWSFTTGAIPDTTPPTVSSTVPANLANAVALGGNIIATFSEAMDASTLTTATMTLKQGTTPVAGAVTYVGTSATFNPTSNLAASTIYTAEITTGAKDLAGNALTSNYSWSFTTGVSPDTTPPTVLSTTPANAATGVLINSKLSASFSEAMDPLTITTANFTLAGPGTAPVAGTMAYAGTTATFTPASVLAGNTLFTGTITTGAKDLAGNALANSYVWTFTTGSSPDTTPPTVIATTPADAALGVLVNGNLTATFSEAMDPLTINTANFTLAGPGPLPVAGTVTYLGTTATFTPSSILASNSAFTATISTGSKDLAGNALLTAFVWSFTTGNAASMGPAVVDLGTAGNYVILAKTGISTVPASALTGDIGLSPAAASFITGFSLVADATNVFSRSTQIVGKAFAANYAVPTPANLTTAVSNMQTAYTDAAGRPTPDFLNLGSGNIGGKTLAPGLYNWTSTITIPSNVTISGGANDVWIFQTSGDLSMSGSQQVILGGAAQAKNIFWQVAGQVVIGTGAHFEGIMLCKTQVTLQTGATMNGRILAQSLVALQQATVTQPAP